MLSTVDGVKLHHLNHLITRHNLSLQYAVDIHHVIIAIGRLLINHLFVISGPAAQDADSDEEWPALGAAGAADDDVGCSTDVVVDPEDEKAMEMFMNKNPPMRQDAASSLTFKRAVALRA